MDLLYKLLFYFVIYAFLGWCTEVLYAYYRKGVFVNRGFLNGPFCPIYGFGCLILVVILYSYRDNLFLLFIFSVLLTSLLEYITGFILEKAFNAKWWDYSDNAFNVKGRICLSFSILWGAASLIVVKFIHPFVESIVSNITGIYALILTYMIILYFSLDFIITLNSIMKLNNLMHQLNEISKEIKIKYSHIKGLALERAEDIKDAALEKAEGIKGAALEKAEDIELSIKELRQRYEHLLENINLNHIRIIKAFPTMTSKKFDNVLKEIQNKIRIKK